METAKRNLSVLKPYLQTMILDNEVKERVEYLNIPTLVDMKTLKADIRKGAAQFSGLEALISKKKEPRYILITTKNLEQGYLAVTYLAACFNRKHGMYTDQEWDKYLNETDTGDREWTECEGRIPVIREKDLISYGAPSVNRDPFAERNYFVEGFKNNLQHRPYWTECVNYSVCIVSRNESGFCAPFQFNMAEDAYESCLRYFQNNEKVYLIRCCSNMDMIEIQDLEDDSSDPYMADYSRDGRWNHIVLSFSADEFFLNTDEKKMKKYYRLLFRGNFAARNIVTAKGFSYERLVNIISVMTDQDKCQLIENIVKYAVKDWDSPDERMIENKDFDFLNRFCRTVVRRKKETKKDEKSGLLDELIGMDEVKKQVLNVVNIMKYNRIRKRMRIGGSVYHNVHVMLGAPGTAKTTVARIMGQMMVDEQLLSDNRFVCVNGAELKGMYVGHSAPKTKALFEQNDIIVIDEAYALVGDYGEVDSFSKEALAQLIIELEEHSTDKLVIFAGYGGKDVTDKNNKMKEFLDANPGIKSRITSTIYFPSYSPREMVEIFYHIAKRQNYLLSKETEGILYNYFEKRVKDTNFGNGREARSLFETSLLYTAERVLKQDKKSYARAEMQAVEYEDVERAIRQAEYADRIQNGSRTDRRIGFETSGHSGRNTI